jgi:nucleotidyltransferase/DNA polymerase involved in DNA repair
MRTVAHWDGDSFFASIEQASDQRLRGRAMVVGGAQRGIVLSASREARRLGIRAGLSTSKARRICPTLVTMPAHFELYERFFDQILGLCRETTPLVEPAAVGAAWLDLTGTSELLKRDAAQVVQGLRRTAHDWLKVSLSAGIATNKLVARVAARLRKPGAQISVPPGEERNFLAPLPLAWLPGLERGNLSALEVAGLRTMGQFAGAPIDALASVLGKSALPLVRRAQGVSEDPVGKKKEREPGWLESVEFAEDVWEEPVLLAHLRKMLEKLMAQVRAAGVEVRQIKLKLQYTDRDEAQKAVALDSPTALDTDFLPRLPALLETTWQRRVRIRAITLRATRVYRPSPQMDLFVPVQKREYERKLASTIDTLRRHYGAAIVKRGWDMNTAPPIQ